jgi:hypothetical protein
MHVEHRDSLACVRRYASQHGLCVFVTVQGIYYASVPGGRVWNPPVYTAKMARILLTTVACMASSLGLARAAFNIDNNPEVATAVACCTNPSDSTFDSAAFLSRLGASFVEGLLAANDGPTSLRNTILSDLGAAIVFYTMKVGVGVNIVSARDDTPLYSSPAAKEAPTLSQTGVYSCSVRTGHSVPASSVSSLQACILNRRPRSYCDSGPMLVIDCRGLVFAPRGSHRSHCANVCAALLFWMRRV